MYSHLQSYLLKSSLPVVRYRKYYNCIYVLSNIITFLKCCSITYRLDAFFLDRKKVGGDAAAWVWQ